MSEPEAISSTRYALLISQLGEELGFKRGWQSQVADRLGVHRSYVSRIHRGDRAGIGVAVIDRAIARMGLEPRFFYEEHLGAAPRYRDFHRPDRVLPPPSRRVVPGYFPRPGEGADAGEILQHWRSDADNEWSLALANALVAEKTGRGTSDEAALALANAVLSMTHVQLAREICETTDPARRGELYIALVMVVSRVMSALEATQEDPR